MHLSDFNYHLPDSLIAQTPIEPRDHSNLLTLDPSSGDIQESKFYEIFDELTPNDVLVLNTTQVIPARLKGNKIWSGREVEIFLHKQISDTTWDCMVFPGKKLKPWAEVIFKLPSPARRGAGGEVLELTAKIISTSHYGKIVEFNQSWQQFLESIEHIGQIPLPPYIKETLENTDRYQTVFADTPGSCAAPTASLHFTPELIQKIQNKWVQVEHVLLHVGLGTFLWVETDDITQHEMHSEYIELKADVANRLNTAKQEWKRIIAVGTTAVRVLESMSDEHHILTPGKTETNIFIYPGYTWKFVDALVTNFHLPKSTLLMLVSSFWWVENIKKAYQYAIEHSFRFFSFWDAMFIRKK